jgi:hypothetical protein
MEFHPDAAKRFDELGRELLQLVVSCGPAEPPLKADFRPDIHPVADIPEDDIVGEVRVTRCIVNGMQEETGRLFSASKDSFGLVDKGYEALTKLAQQIQTTSVLRDSVRVEFIRDIVFDWVGESYGKSTVEPVSVVVLRKATGEIKDYEMWVPIHRSYVEVPIPMGDVVFQTVTAAMMDAWQAGARADTKEEEAVLRLYLSEQRSRLQGCAAATTKVRAEHAPRASRSPDWR